MLFMTSGANGNRKWEATAPRGAIEFENCILRLSASGGGGGVCLYHKQTYVEELGRNAVKGTGSVEKCEHGALLLLMVLAEAPEQGDVIRRRSTW